MIGSRSARQVDDGGWMDREKAAAQDSPSGKTQPARRKLPYEPPRILTDEAFEQISLACTQKPSSGVTKKNFT
jgi:hypothetical protein